MRNRCSEGCVKVVERSNGNDNMGTTGAQYCLLVNTFLPGFANLYVILHLQSQQQQ